MASQDTCMAGGLGGVSDEKFAQAKKELAELLAKGERAPDRGNLDKEGIVWRYGKPEYTIANLSFLKGKSMQHKAGSLEEIVENIVKTWEMEASHKANIEQWDTVNLEGGYKVNVNGGEWVPGRLAAEMGNYNAMLAAVPKEKYDSTKETFDSSHHVFRDSFPNGFAWELLEVFAGPPKLMFSWRHWARFEGTYRGNKGEGQLVEMYGFCQATVDENLKILSLEIFYKPEEFLDLLEGKGVPAEVTKLCPFFASKANKKQLASTCPLSSVPWTPLAAGAALAAGAFLLLKRK